MAALVERHDGRIVNTWGDMVIAEFASVVEAVQCAVETQQELSGHDRDLPEARRMRFRIGINLGDVMVEGADIYGDGVNIAARLQERAEPGGILISGPVYDQVHSKLSVGFELPRLAAGEERRDARDELSREPGRRGRRTASATGDGAVRPRGADEGGRRRRSDPERSGPLHAGLERVRPLAPHVRHADRDRRLPGPDQRLHRPARDLVPLAGRAAAAGRRSSGRRSGASRRSEERARERERTAVEHFAKPPRPRFLDSFPAPSLYPPRPATRLAAPRGGVAQLVRAAES